LNRKSEDFRQNQKTSSLIVEFDFIPVSAPAVKKFYIKVERGGGSGAPKQYTFDSLRLAELIHPGRQGQHHL